MNIQLVLAQADDYNYIATHDHHLPVNRIANKLAAQEIYLIRLFSQPEPIGWLRYSYFWDEIPFLNLLWLDEEYRQHGIGRQVMLEWEQYLRNKGHQKVMTSTQSDETAQHFYRKLGYIDAGALLQEEEPLEIVFIKTWQEA